MKISSPMATGNGAYIIHKVLEEKIPGYHVNDYSPYWTIFPPALPFLNRSNYSADIIHTTPDHAWFFKNKKTPLIITFHNFVLDQFMTTCSSFSQQIHYKTDLRYFTRKSLKHAHHVTSVSQYTADIVRKELSYSGQIEVIYNGVDKDMFSPKRKSSGKNIKVLFSGNLTSRKGAYLLPQIAKKLGRGIEILYTQGLRTRIKLPKLPNLKCIGAVSFAQMPNIYNQADILLFPTFREGFGLAAAEAMACGLPVIASNCSSLPELVVDGSGGYLCEMGNVDEFATKINTLSESPELRHEMGEFNRNRVEIKFAVERMVNEYADLFMRSLSR
ncbi:glycosyltransferase family 4 protein [Pseudomonadota bacterium]